jgi:acetyl-CoA carboxylase carboxyl transferase subunit alpha
MERDLDFEKPIAEMEKAIERLKHLAEENKGDFSSQIQELEIKCEERKREIYENLTPWQIVQIARHPDRPVLQDYISMVCSDFIELHGDRCYGDDRALIGGFATVGSAKVVLIGHNKGKTTEEKIRRNFGMANPEGYRKALRLMRLAQQYNLPVVTLIDTPAAYPGKEAEERGQHEAIARNLTEMAKLQVPVITIVTGEGGSGGALGIAIGDVVSMLSNAIYSVIPPEGCAAILWRDAAYTAQAADALKLTAKSLLELGVIDDIIPEPPGGAHSNPQATADVVKKYILKYLKKFDSWSPAKLESKRFDKYAAMGQFNK